MPLLLAAAGHVIGPGKGLEYVEGLGQSPAGVQHFTLVPICPPPEQAVHLEVYAKEVMSEVRAR